MVGISEVGYGHQHWAEVVLTSHIRRDRRECDGLMSPPFLGGKLCSLGSCSGLMCSALGDMDAPTTAAEFPTEIPEYGAGIAWGRPARIRNAGDLLRVVHPLI